MNTHYIPNVLAYTGSKYRLLKQLLPLFPTDYARFVDLFTGGGVVSINQACRYPNRSYHMNDTQLPVIRILESMQRLDSAAIDNKVSTIINQYGLKGSIDTKKAPDEHWQDINRVAYNRLRNDYNHHAFKGDDDAIVLYTLLMYGFNHQLRFNRQGLFNTSVGNRTYNQRLKRAMIDSASVMKQSTFTFSCLDFEAVPIQSGDFVYLDPPYLLGTATYNESHSMANGKKRWAVADEKRLYAYLDRLDAKGILWALSNVVEHKGQINHILEEWMQRYTVVSMNRNYNNANYQSTAKQYKTREILIINY